MKVTRLVPQFQLFYLNKAFEFKAPSNTPIMHANRWKQVMAV